MKFLLCILLNTPLFCMSQEPPVKWEVFSKKLDSGRYEIKVNAFMSGNWYLYAENNMTEGLEPPHLTWNHERITADKGLKSLLPSVFIQDRIFNKSLKVHEGAATFIQKLRVQGSVPSNLKLTISSFASNGTEFLPISEEINLALQGGVEKDLTATIKLATIDLANPVSNCGEKQGEHKSLLNVFLLGFIGGLIALFTPCVFPMIPVTVSFFTGKAKSRKMAIGHGILYGTFIFLIYALASLPFHIMGNLDPQIFNTISTNAWVNVFFFGVFILFALSFFGLFEIKFPASVSNLAGSKSSLGSTAGIFFMALTLAVVSFSCTGPILGSLLVGSISSDGGAWQLSFGMSGFGLALGLPFALFAIFPQWMKSLPKSGGWLETVKKSLAFVELALAIKFLSNADLVEHWGILKREVFIALWILISLGLALYLLGIFDKKKPNPTLRLVLPTEKTYSQRISPGRFIMGILTLIFTLYLTPGITQTRFANLKLLSGFPPPLSYSIYGKDNVHGKGLEPNEVNNYQKAVDKARQLHKPILIDFTGWACVNCRKMEEQIWTKPEIEKIIKENFILVSLYVDDREQLPADERFTYKSSNGKEKYINTLGDKWATFQAENFAQVTQPLYVILSPDEKLMNHPVGYTPSVSEYRQWLECGLEAFRKSSKTSAVENRNLSILPGHSLY